MGLLRTRQTSKARQRRNGKGLGYTSRSHREIAAWSSFDNLCPGFPVSRFPLTFEFLGWFAIAAAVIILILGHERLRKFVAWFERFSHAMIRVWLLFGIAFGAFLLFGGYP